MPWLTDVWVGFLQSLFNKDPKDRQRKSDLRRIYRELRSTKPAYFRQASSQILPGFADSVMQLIQALNPICRLIEVTVANRNEKLAERSQDYLVEVRLPPDQSDRRLSFAYEAMKERILNSASPDEELQKIGQEFQSFTRNFSGLEFTEADNEYKEIDRLAALCGQDFEKTLSLFDPNVNLASRTYKPAFTPAVGEQVLPELLDMYFIIAGLNLSRGVEANLTRLQDRVSETRGDTPSAEMRRSVTRLQRVLDRRFPPHLLLNCIRAVKEDPYFSPGVDNQPKPILEGYKRKITEQFDKNRGRIARERKESGIVEDIQSLFEGAELLPIDGYNEEEGTLLEDEGFSSFTAVKPLRILKSFLATRLDKPIRHVVDKLLLDGFYENKNFQNSFTSIFYQCDEVTRNLAAFEKSMRSEDKVSIQTIEKYRAEHTQGKPVKAFLNRLIETVDRKAVRIVEEGTNCLHGLAGYLLDIINDFKQATPSFVSNIKALGGTKNREFAVDLVNAYNDLVKLTRIMKNFIVVKSLDER